MALITIYQGNSKTLALSFTDSNGTPINVSGWLVRGTAKQSYTQSNAQAFINKVITGAAPEAVTGLMNFPITSGESAQCPGDYLFDFTSTDLSSGVSTFATEGLRILPTTYVA